VIVGRPRSLRTPSLRRSAARDPPRSEGRGPAVQRVGTTGEWLQGAGSIPDGLRTSRPETDRGQIESSAPPDASIVPGEAGRASAPGTRNLAADIVSQTVQHGGSYKAGLLCRMVADAAIVVLAWHRALSHGAGRSTNQPYHAARIAPAAGTKGHQNRRIALPISRRTYQSETLPT
jgi:hypothetical protein